MRSRRSAMCICGPWARTISTVGAGYYPVFDRQGLIIDVRHNGGGISTLGCWRSCFARRGSLATASRQSELEYAVRVSRTHCGALRPADRVGWRGLSEGFRRLGLGKIIGVRTWGGEIWLSASNLLADAGSLRRPRGVYGPEGKWLIEGHGVDPDIVVDDLPHATFAGSDAQLEAAMDICRKRSGRSATGA